MSGLDEYVPQRFTVGRRQGLTESAMRALVAATERENHDDPREMAATLILEGLERRGLLPTRAHVEAAARQIAEAFRQDALSLEAFPGADADMEAEDEAED